MKATPFFALVAIITATVCFSSCNKENPEKTETVSASFSVDPGTNSDFESIYEIIFEYSIESKGASSQSSKLSLTEPLEFKNLACPCSITIDYSYSYKSSAIIGWSKEYQLEWGPSYTVTTNNGHSSSQGTSTSMTIVGRNIVEMFDEYNTINHKTTIVIDESGNIITSQVFSPKSVEE